MSAVDYPGLLATLEQQDRALAAEREDLAVIIAAVRKRAGAVVLAGLTIAPARNGHAKRKVQPAAASVRIGIAGGQSKITPEQVATIKRLYEAGWKTAEICKAAKVSSATIYARVKAEGWQRKPGTPAKPAPPPPTPKGTQLSGSVRCDHCGRMTDYDPCRGCGKPLTKKW